MRAQNTLLHKKRSFGDGGRTEFKAMVKVIAEHEIDSVIDYGCGKGTLGVRFRLAQEKHRMDRLANIEDARCFCCGQVLPTKPTVIDNVTWQDYDPAIEKVSRLPKPADLVMCRDVLEHVEPELLDNVFEHIHSLANKAVYLVIPRNASTVTLPDGRNSHLTQQKAKWWIKRFSKWFTPAEEMNGYKDIRGVFLPKEK